MTKRLIMIAACAFLMASSVPTLAEQQGNTATKQQGNTATTKESGSMKTKPGLAGCILCACGCDRNVMQCKECGPKIKSQ